MLPAKIITSVFCMMTVSTAKVSSVNCYSGDGATYRGSTSRTERGTLCLNWTTSTIVSPKTHPEKGLGDHNYCRNPDGERKPWCWISRRRFAFCAVPKCALGENCGRRPLENKLLDLRIKRFLWKSENKSRVVGGNFAMYGMFPWQAGILKVIALHTDGSVETKPHCGGTILEEFWILTAAHCFKNVGKNLVVIHVGDYNIHQREMSEQHFILDELIVHPLFDADSNDYDIALLKLKPRFGKGIHFSDYVQPACLPSQDTLYSNGQLCEISGWGYTNLYHSTLLREAKVQLLNDSLCRQYHGGDTTSRMFCAGFIQGGVDACQGDSGGPLVCSLNARATVLGITSWGVECGLAFKPGVYTRVSSFTDWITENIKTK